MSIRVALSAVVLSAVVLSAVALRMSALRVALSITGFTHFMPVGRFMVKYTAVVNTNGMAAIGRMKLVHSLVVRRDFSTVVFFASNVDFSMVTSSTPSTFSTASSYSSSSVSSRKIQLRQHCAHRYTLLFKACTNHRRATQRLGANTASGSPTSRASQRGRCRSSTISAGGAVLAPACCAMARRTHRVACSHRAPLSNSEALSPENVPSYNLPTCMPRADARIGLATHEHVRLLGGTKTS